MRRHAAVDIRFTSFPVLYVCWSLRRSYLRIGAYMPRGKEVLRHSDPLWKIETNTKIKLAIQQNCRPVCKGTGRTGAVAVAIRTLSQLTFAQRRNSDMFTGSKHCIGTTSTFCKLVLSGLLAYRLVTIVEMHQW